jgi:predicted DNA-binding transcriptional regulator AlpA
MTVATINAEQLAQLLGVSRYSVYEAAKAGTLPIPPIRVGRRMVWSAARVADLLGVESLDLGEHDDG